MNYKASNDNFVNLIYALLSIYFESVDLRAFLPQNPEMIFNSSINVFGSLIHKYLSIRLGPNSPKSLAVNQNLSIVLRLENVEAPFQAANFLSVLNRNRISAPAGASASISALSLIFKPSKDVLPPDRTKLRPSSLLISMSVA